MGLVIDENKPEYERGTTGDALSAPTRRPGRCRRSAPRADAPPTGERRRGTRQTSRRGRAPAGALLFTCNVAGTSAAHDRPALTQYVYDFDEDAPGGRELLGGKGVGLAEMTQLGIPVPAGFTITTDACRAYMSSGKQLPEGLEDEIDEHLRRLEERTGKRFGDPDEPLLVSVRSGAAVSMPGMMDTVLNLGLNDEAVEGLGQPRRLGLVPAPDPDVRRGRRGHRRAPLRRGRRLKSKARRHDTAPARSRQSGSRRQVDVREELGRRSRRTRAAS